MRHINRQQCSSKGLRSLPIELVAAYQQQHPEACWGQSSFWHLNLKPQYWKICQPVFQYECNVLIWKLKNTQQSYNKKLQLQPSAEPLAPSSECLGLHFTFCTEDSSKKFYLFKCEAEELSSFLLIKLSVQLDRVWFTKLQ